MDQLNRVKWERLTVRYLEIDDLIAFYPVQNQDLILILY